MHVLDILAFWKSTADSFQHKFFHNLCFRNAVNRDTSARLSTNVISLFSSSCRSYRTFPGYDTWRCESPVNKYLFVLCLPEGELTRWITTFMCKIRDFLELFFSVHPRTLYRNHLHPERIEDGWIFLLSRSKLLRNFIQSSDLKDSLFAALTLVHGRFVPQRRKSVSRYWMCSSMLLAWSEIHNVALYYKGPINDCPFTLNCPATTSG